MAVQAILDGNLKIRGYAPNTLDALPQAAAATATVGVHTVTADAADTAANGLRFAIVIGNANGIRWDAANRRITFTVRATVKAQRLTELWNDDITPKPAGTPDVTLGLVAGTGANAATVAGDAALAGGRSAWRYLQLADKIPLGNTVTLDAQGAYQSDAAPPGPSAKRLAAIGLHDGLIAFRDFVLRHAAGVPQSSVDKVLAFLWQAHRAAHLVVRGEATGVNLTDAQIIAWCNAMRLGPADTSVVTETGVYDEAGLFAIFEKAEAPGAPATPILPIAWVDLDITTWTADADGNANAVPERLNINDIDTLMGDVTQYLDVYSLSWLEGI